MVKSCYVVSCKHSEKEKVLYYRIPAIISENNKRYNGFGQEKKQQNIIQLSKQRQEAWIRALKRGPLNDIQLKNARICGKHFLSGRPAKLEDENNPDWVPSQCLGYNIGVAVKKKSALGRYERIKKRVKNLEPPQVKLETIYFPDVEIDEWNASDIEIHAREHETGTASQTDLTMDDISNIIYIKSIFGV